MTRSFVTHTRAHTYTHRYTQRPQDQRPTFTHYGLGQQFKSYPRMLRAAVLTVEHVHEILVTIYSYWRDVNSWHYGADQISVPKVKIIR